MLNKVVAGRFRITGLLGSGGMGQVWAAEDERMRRDVAVKIVHPQHGVGEAETQARFRREVQLAGRLSHHNIVTVHDWGEVEVDGGRETLYVVMELVRGVSLGKRLKDIGTAPWPTAVGWAAQIAQALDTAHRQEVVHRDIKPANVLLTDEGVVKVLDFGVAKFLGETIGARDLTVTGTPLGSPKYMSPEQAEGVREIDHRSDLYSLGCLLYHAVTGRPPFTSATPWAVLRMQIEDPPVPPVERSGGIPAALNELILHLLAKDPEDRPRSAAVVHETLVTILVEHALMRPGGDLLDLGELGHALAVSGRFLTVARAEAARIVAEAEEVKAGVTTWVNGMLTGLNQEMKRLNGHTGAGDPAAERAVPAVSEEDYYRLFKRSIDGMYPTADQLVNAAEVTYGTRLPLDAALGMVLRFTNRHTAELQEDHIA
ncbi:serine/threonine-protein kinase [Streptomyces griseorubiginosus]|uniref:serine/threonine-protein kinase n=1 Tax=Streptomyces griseorubiginosus TaxID=67304 RepID=UPI00362522D7